MFKALKPWGRESLGLTARPPPSPGANQKDSSEWYLPSWAALRQAIFSDPYRNLCIGVSKTHGEMYNCDLNPRKTRCFGNSTVKKRTVKLTLLQWRYEKHKVKIILALLFAILAPRSRNIVKDASKNIILEPTSSKISLQHSPSQLPGPFQEGPDP